MPPWLLVSPSLVVHYVADRAALQQLAEQSSVRLDHLLQLVGAEQSTFTTGGSGLKNSEVKARSRWVLLSKVHWLQRDDTKELVPVGGDVDFFVDSIASRRPDMQHFKANRLKLFLARQLFNSGKRVELYAGRGREAAARGWRLAKDAPVDAHLRIPRVLDGSPFAFPSCAASVERDLSESLEPCGVDGPLRHAPQAAQAACGDGSAAAARDPQVTRLPALAPC